MEILGYVSTGPVPLGAPAGHRWSRCWNEPTQSLECGLGWSLSWSVWASGTPLPHQSRARASSPLQGQASGPVLQGPWKVGASFLMLMSLGPVRGRGSSPAEAGKGKPVSFQTKATTAKSKYTLILLLFYSKPLH